MVISVSPSLRTLTRHEAVLPARHQVNNYHSLVNNNNNNNKLLLLLLLLLLHNLLQHGSGHWMFKMV